MSHAICPLWGSVALMLSALLFTYAWLSDRRHASLERERDALAREREQLATAVTGLRSELRGRYLWDGR